MSIARKILLVYRKFQYKICGRHKMGVMSAGTLCSHTPFEQEINHDDVVHPCVRYIPEGYLGHNWWMVYTPYFHNDEKIENPILCFADTEGKEPPTHWRVFCQVQKQPTEGYNSDPVLLYYKNILYVFWRENFTKRCRENGLSHATFGSIVVENGISDIFGPVVGTKEVEVDSETSPCFIVEKDGTYRCLATHITFHSKTISEMPVFLKKIINPVVLLLDLLGVWSQQKAHGIAQWSCSSIDGKFHLDRTVKFSNKNILYRPWHIDFFEWRNKLYAIIQTNQCNADICLAESEDRINFRFFNKPLMTNYTCRKVGIYKPTGGVVNGNFFLYYTAQDFDNRSLNKLYLTTIDFNELIQKIQ